jgi:hypothetical protein
MKSKVLEEKMDDKKNKRNRRRRGSKGRNMSRMQTEDQTKKKKEGK